MLGEAQKYLELRYAGLATNRRENRYSVYALEHGFDEAQLTQIRQFASQSIRFRSPDDEHWLVWAALGAEAGYQYSGDEFWPALERSTGEWRSNDYRQKLRQFYRRFQKTYGGAIPVGRWAEHFSIISWPISNAILPRYLQTHFASHIYDLRFDLAHAAKRDCAQIGGILLEKYDGSSSRFGDFLQQTDLTTQIVLALRDQESTSQVHRIEPELLNRIVRDLEGHRYAKLYLRDARKVIRSTGISISSRLQTAPERIVGESGQRDIAHTRSKLTGRMAAGGIFHAGIRLPDISGLIRRAGISAQALSGYRVRFLGSDERFMPASTLISLSKLDRALSVFPEDNAPLFSLEAGDTDLREIIEASNRIEERPTWLLRKQIDGSYHEVGHVRSGSEYVVMCRSEPSKAALQDGGLDPVLCRTTNVFAFTLSVPSKFSEKKQNGLKALGISSVVGVSIEPVGLNPLPSKIGDSPSWLSTEPVALRLTSDFELDEFRVSLNGGTAQSFSAMAGEAFIQLPDLQPGFHTVAVLFNHKSESFVFEVRPPLPWKEAIRQKSGFRLLADPSEATLEQLFNGRASVHVNGPQDRAVNWSFETYDASGHLAAICPLRATKIGSPPQIMFENLDRGRREFSDRLDDAYRVDLVASLDELGRQALRFPRTIEPLRWKFSATDKTVRLIDETDHSEPITVNAYGLDAPLDGKPVDVSTVLNGLEVGIPGTLFEATYSGGKVSIFVSRPKEMRGLADLGVQQTYGVIGQKIPAILNLIQSINRWQNARPVGEFASVRKATTINTLKAEIAKLTCGYNFATTLETRTDKALDDARAKIGGSPGFRSRMRNFGPILDLGQAQRVFADYASTYGVEGDAALSEAAFILCYDPSLLHSQREKEFEQLLSDILGKKILLRGAYLASVVGTLSSFPQHEKGAA